MAPLSAVVGAMLIYSAACSPKYRAELLAFFGGVAAYFAVALFIQVGFLVWDETDTWWSLTAPLWEWQHGKLPISETVNGFEREDYLSFVIASHMTLAVLISAFTTFVLRLLARQQNAQCP